MMSNIIKIHLFKNARIGITADTGVQTVDKAPSCEGAFLGLRAMGAL